MIKCVIFDLDGVLVDADRLHFDAFNRALTINDLSPISWHEHLTIYKGLPTRKKLDILTERKGLSKELYASINDLKQRITGSMIYTNIIPDLEKIEMLKLLKQKYKIYVCSNAIKETVESMLNKSALNFYVEGYLCNGDVQNPKPDPEIYLKLFQLAMVAPEECVIVEDSDVGFKAAIDSGAFVCKVAGPEEVNYYRVLKTILDSERINVVVPAAGQGKRFSEAGFQHPKPMIVVDECPMLSLVLENFRYLGRNILVMQKPVIDKYCVKDILKYKDFTVEIVPVDGLTEGAACTVLLAKHFIDTNNELIIANSDQYLSHPKVISMFVKRMRQLKADGGIMTFQDDNVKWSYAKIDSNQLVTEVAEKNPISNHATVGIYYYKYGKDFIKYAEQMIAKNIRTNNEFYVCPVYNEFIQDGKKIYIYEIAKEIMHGLGTPEDLEQFLKVAHNENLL